MSAISSVIFFALKSLEISDIRLYKRSIALFAHSNPSPGISSIHPAKNLLSSVDNWMSGTSSSWARINAASGISSSSGAST